MFALKQENNGFARGMQADKGGGDSLVNRTGLFCDLANKTNLCRLSALHGNRYSSC